MGIMEILQKRVDGAKAAFQKTEKEDQEEKVTKETKPKQTKEERQREKRDNQNVTLVDFRYDKEKDEYVWNETTKMKRKDLPAGVVHMTGKKNTYVLTDIWDELVWAGTGQSAIHMYLWMINTKINPEAIGENKKNMSELDMKKIIMYGAIGIVVLIVAWQFIPKT